MSGPYNYDYLIPEIRIPLNEPIYEEIERFELNGTTEWLHGHFETLNADMKNPWTGANCFTDNCSIITALAIVMQFYRFDGLEDLPKGTIEGWRLDCERYEDLFCRTEDGTTCLRLGPDYQPELWTPADRLSAACHRAKDRLIEGDAALLEAVRKECGWGIRGIDLNEFLPPEEATPEVEYDGSLFIEEDDPELDDRSMALVGASAFATIAFEADRLHAQGAGKLAILDASHGIGFAAMPPVTPEGAPLTDAERRELLGHWQNEHARRQKGWLRRLLGW